jgi:transcription initiation factor TFIIH subunit 2
VCTHVQAESTAASLVQMGFPQRARVEARPQPAACTHAGTHVCSPALASRSSSAQASTYFCAGTGGDFVCPRCKGRLAELPGECPVCRLTLVSSPHLARSYHHLFPVAPYEEVLAPSGDGVDVPDAPEATAAAAAAAAAACDAACFGCGESLRGDAGGGADAAGGVVLRCPRCTHCFCFRCDSYVHEALHNCPGCECAPEA